MKREAIEFAALLGAKRTLSGWQGNCPAHNDTTASLSIAEGDDGRLLAHCHAGCEFRDIVEATETYSPKKAAPQSRAAAEDFTNQIVKCYTYNDADGIMQYQAVRLEPKSFRQRRPDGHGGWINNMKGVTRIPYLLNEWYHEDPKRTIIFVEGEKDAEAARDLGFYATTIMGGAAAWRGEMAPWFDGRKVIIIPDNDEAGEKFATAVYTSLHTVAAAVKIVRLPGLPDKGDLSDWIEAGGTKGDLMDLIKATPNNQDVPNWSLEQQLADQSPEWDMIGESYKDMVEARARQLATGKSGITFIKTGFTRLDKRYGGFETKIVTIVGARPSIGKSTALALLALNAAKTGNKVLWISLEDSDLRVSEKALANAFGALYEKNDADSVVNPQRFVNYTAPEWMDNIRLDRVTNGIEEIGLCIRSGMFDMVLIDYAQKINSGLRENEIASGRIIIDELNSAAQEGECAVVLAAQVNRSGESDIQGELVPPTMSNLRGSGFWEQGAKSIMLLHRDTRAVKPPQKTRKGQEEQIDTGLGPNQLLWIIAKNNARGTGHLVMDIDMESCRIEDQGDKLFGGGK